MGSMKKRAILTAVLIGLSIFDPSYGAAQTRLRTSIELSGETARIPASEVIPNYTTSTSYGIDYLEYLPPHRSVSDRAAQIQSTLGGLCHVGRIPGTRLEIAQSCPAERGKKDRLKAWRDFYNAQGEAPIPKRSEVYLVHDRRWFYPVVERELKNGDKLKNPLSLSLSPACAFPNPARGERITELCARSIPVQVPPFAAKIEGSDVILTRLQSAPASAYLTFSAQGREVARVEVRVEAPVVVSPQPPSAGVGALPCLPGEISVNYKYIDKDLDGYYAPAPLAPGKNFASVCLLQGTRLPYLDPVTRTWYAMTTGGSGEDARCDGDVRGQVYVDLPRYWGDRDLDGYFAEYVTPVKGCLGRPTATNYLGYLQTPGQPSMRIMARAPAGATEPQSTDRDPTKPAFPNAPGPNPQGPNPNGPNPQGPNRPDPTICNDPNALNHGQELPCLYPTCGDGKVEGNEECDPEVPDDKTCRQCCLPDSTKNECQCVWRPELCTENDPCVSNPTAPGCDPCKENPELCPQCGCRELTSHSYRVQVNITTFGGPSDSGVTSTERGSVDGLRLRSRDPKSELYTAWPLPSAEKLLGLPDTSDCLGPEKESWEGEKIAAANEALKDYLVRITYVDPTGDYRTIDVPINDRGPGKATRWDASERVWRDLGVWKSDEDVKSTNPNDPAHMVELEIQLIPRNGVCP